MDQPDFNLLDPDFHVGDPHPAYRWLRHHDPVHEVKGRNLWAITRHDDVRDVERRKDEFVSNRGYRWHDIPGEGSIIAIDDPAHQQQRRQYSKGFTPRASTARAGEVHQIVDACLDDIGSATQTEIVGSIAARIPAVLTARMIGLDDNDWGQVRLWSERLMRLDVAEKDRSVYDGIIVTVGEMQASLATILQSTSGVPVGTESHPLGTEPGHDDSHPFGTGPLASTGADGDAGVAATDCPVEPAAAGATSHASTPSSSAGIDSGEAPPADDGNIPEAWRRAHAEGRMDVRSLVDEMALLVSGGAETTRTTIARGLIELARRPEDWERLAAEPDTIPLAVEELIRHLTPLNNMFRTSVVDTEVAGVTIPAGARIMLCYPSANRDEDHFDRPDELDLSRSPNHHLSFGFGTHVCLGAHVARTTLAVTFERLTREWTRLEPRSEPDYEPNIFVKAVRSFDLGFEWR